MLQKFIDQYTGKLVNFDGAPNSEGQAVQLIASWCQYLGLPYQWANPFDWWDDADENFAEHWNKVYRTADNNAMPRPGDIVVFSNSLPGTDGCGALTIFVSGVEGEAGWIGFDASWGGRSAHLQSHNWAYVVGWFTPENPAVLEAQIPTAIALPFASEPYDVQIVEAFMVVIQNDLSPLYNLQDVSWDSFNTNHISYAHVGDEVAVTAIAKHRLGGTFYMSDAATGHGYSVEDCEDYDDGRDPVAPPELKRGINIAAPHMAPSKTDTIQILKEIPKYNWSSDALADQNRIGNVVPDKYFVYKRLPSGMMNLTSYIGQSGFWINPEDLLEHDWHELVRYPAPRYLRALTDAPIVDMDGREKTLRIAQGSYILAVGTFKGPDGQFYATPQVTFEQGHWYGMDPGSFVQEDPPKPKPAPVVVAEPELPLEYPFAVKVLLLLQNSHVLRTIKEKLGNDTARDTTRD